MYEELGERKEARKGEMGVVAAGEERWRWVRRESKKKARAYLLVDASLHALCYSTSIEEPSFHREISGFWVPPTFYDRRINNFQSRPFKNPTFLGCSYFFSYV